MLRPKGTEEIADAIQQMHRDHTERGTKFLVRPITQVCCFSSSCLNSGYRLLAAQQLL